MKRIFYIAPSYTKALLLLFFLAVSIGLSAQASLSVQGVLTRSDGTAVDDGNDYTLTFRLWTAESGGTKVHEETINNISIVGGVYSVVLGVEPGNPPLTAPFNQTYWLGVSVNTSSVELLPRPRLTHAPYALGLVGQNNIFPSTGPVIGDAFRAKGGPATGGQGPSANGFSFHTIGDDAGGMFSEGGNNIELWAGATRKIKLTNGLNELYGPTNTNALSVYGTLTSDNINPFVANGTVTVNGSETVTGNAQINGSTNTNGNTTTGGYFYTKRKQNNGGYTFIGDGGNDSGLFSFNDGDIALYANNQEKIRMYPNYMELKGGDIYTLNPLIVSSNLYLNNVPDFDGKNMQWNQNTGLVGADNSTRRAKFNIKPLEDDFSLILKAQPRTYTRKVDPNHWEIGYIAEEMDSLGLKHLVEYDKDGRPDGYNYEKMILYVTEVLKMQDAAIQQLNAEVAALKSENSGLTTQNNNLQTTNASLQKQQEKFNGQLEGLLKRMQALEASSTGK